MMTLHLLNDKAVFKGEMQPKTDCSAPDLMVLKGKSECIKCNMWRIKLKASDSISTVSKKKITALNSSSSGNLF